MDLIDGAFGASWENGWAPSLPAGLFTDLLVDGIIAGVGGVIIFLPQILFLFFFLGILESTGYMARAAFLMDGIDEQSRPQWSKLFAAAQWIRLCHSRSDGGAFGAQCQGTSC